MYVRMYTVRMTTYERMYICMYILYIPTYLRTYLCMYVCMCLRSHVCSYVSWEIVYSSMAVRHRLVPRRSGIASLLS